MELQWNTLDMEHASEFPTSRQGHSLSYDPVKDKYIIFGGYNTKRLSELWFFNSRLNAWEKPKTKGKQPNARSNHAAWLDDDYFYVFGGKSEKPLMNDLFVLNIPRMEWKRCCLFEPPEARCHHAMVKLQDKKEVILYGGASPTKNSVFSDLWILNTAEVNAEAKVKQLPGVVWHQLQQTGDLPGPRTGHAMIQIPDSSLVYMIGGSHKLGLDPIHREQGEQIYSLQLVTMEWKFIKLDRGAESTLGRRVYHGLAILPSKQILVFGGEQWGQTCPRKTCLFNADKKTVIQGLKSEPLPRQRFGMSSNGWEVLVIGGLEQHLVSMEPLRIAGRLKGAGGRYATESISDNEHFSPRATTFGKRRISMNISPRVTMSPRAIKLGLLERKQGEFFETENTRIAKASVAEKRLELIGLRQGHAKVVETRQELERQRDALRGMVESVREENEERIKRLKLESAMLQKNRLAGDRQVQFLRGKLENEKALQVALGQKIAGVMEFFQKQEKFLIQLDKLRFKTLQAETTTRKVEVDDAQLEEQRAAHLSKLQELATRFPALQAQEAKLREEAERSEKELGVVAQETTTGGEELMLSKIESEED